MGQLPICYSHSHLAIVAGSYVEHVGGHNVLEPLLYGIPVLFGPHTYGQAELASLAITSGAGMEVPLNRLRQTIEEFFNNPAQQEAMRAAGSKLIQSSRGATNRTVHIVRPVFLLR